MSNSKLREVIFKNSGAKNFAKHFSTKENIKHLLKGYPNAAMIQPFFINDDYSEEVLTYSDIRKNMDIILSEVFETYIEEYEETLRKKGETKGYGDKVQFLLGLIDEKKNSVKDDSAPMRQIILALGDFAKSRSGKLIQEVLKSSGNEGDEKLMDILLMIAVRRMINDVMNNVKHEDVTPVEAEIVSEEEFIAKKEPRKEEPSEVNFVIIDNEPKEKKAPEHRAHAKVETGESSAPKKSTEVVAKKSTSNGHSSNFKRENKMTFEEILEELKECSDDNLEYAILGIRKMLKKNWSEFKKSINRTSTYVDYGPSIHRDMLSTIPGNLSDEVFHGINIENLTKKLTQALSTAVRCERGSEEDYVTTVLAVHMFILVTGLIVTLDDDDRFVDYGSKIINYLRITDSIDEHKPSPEVIDIIKSTEPMMRVLNRDIDRFGKDIPKVFSLRSFGNVSAKMHLDDAFKYVREIA